MFEGCEYQISYGERMIFNLLNHNKKIPFERWELITNGLIFIYQIAICFWSMMESSHYGRPVVGETTRESQQANDALKDDIAVASGTRSGPGSNEDDIDDIIRKLEFIRESAKRKGFDYNKPVNSYRMKSWRLCSHDVSAVAAKYGLGLSLVRLNKEFNQNTALRKQTIDDKLMNSPFTRPKKKRKKD